MRLSLDLTALFSDNVTVTGEELIKLFGHVTSCSWQDKQEVNLSHIEC